MRIVFRVDASIQIGSGHVMRCLTLADGLRARGAQVCFVSRAMKGNLLQFIQSKGYKVNALPSPASRLPPLTWNRHAHWLEADWERDAEETRQILRGEDGEIDWLIIDHYALDRQWESRLRLHATRIMVIDDLADRPHDCDLLLDQNFYGPMQDGRYEGLVAGGCQKLLGPHYALLRPEFGAARQNLDRPDGTVKRILIFYGAMDSTGETEKALQAVIRLNHPDVAIDVVVGQANSRREFIRTNCAALAKVEFHCQIDYMAELMVQADLALGAGGTATWERCCLGLPAIVTTVAENQVPLTALAADEGLVLWLGSPADATTESLVHALETMLRSPALVKALSRRCRDFVDGQGARRVVSWLTAPEISLRRANPDDCDEIHRWRNAEETRRFIFSPEPIPLESHRLWYGEALTNHSCILLVGELAEKPVGVLRYDLHEAEAVISIYLVPGNHGKGLGVQLIRAGSNWVREHFGQVRTIKAEVLAANISSRKAFLNAGFKEHHLTFKEELH
jgi:UDP-2,4-diacetamido-2,4,6-trideoxy-beta-L-altropyranose hydrolase